MLSLVAIAINHLLKYTDFPENITSTASIIIGHTTVVYVSALKVRSTGSVKRQKESERKSISDRHPALVQQVVQQQVNTLAEALENGYAS